MWKQAISSLLMLVILTAVTGLAYPLIITGLAQATFPRQANGSMIEVNGKVIGSALIGQNFTNPKYFQGRPSAAGENGYDAAASAASNLGPTSQKLIDAAKERVENIRFQNGLPASQMVSADAVLASGSGLDPHITPEYAYLQASRVATVRDLSVETVRDLIKRHLEDKQLGFLGEPRVNVLKLNIALDALRGS